MNKHRKVVSMLLVSLCLATFGKAVEADKGWHQKEFIITFWCPPPANDEALAAVKAEGFNLTWTPVEGLDVAARHGLRVMLTSDLLNPESLDNDVQRAKLDALIEQVKKHPALEAYYITDEPERELFPDSGNLLLTCGNVIRAISLILTCSRPTRMSSSLALALTLPSGPGLDIHKISLGLAQTTKRCSNIVSI